MPAHEQIQLHHARGRLGCGSIHDTQQAHHLYQSLCRQQCYLGLPVGMQLYRPL